MSANYDNFEGRPRENLLLHPHLDHITTILILVLGKILNPHSLIHGNFRFGGRGYRPRNVQ